MNRPAFPLEVSYFTRDGIPGRIAAFKSADPRTVRFLRFCRRMREHGLWRWRLDGSEIVVGEVRICVDNLQRR